MKQLQIPYCTKIGIGSDLAEISHYLDKLERTRIETELWTSTGYKPQVTLAIAHSGDGIFIKFHVAEKYMQAVYRQTNEPVSKDSCVEFFIALDDGGNYYNFEFNCIGTGLMGFGTKNRKGRNYLPAALIDRIRRQVFLKAGTNTIHDLFNWEITVAIPLEVFCYHKLSSLEGLKCSANFHKCGDNLPEPHYIVWNEIRSKQPDFHLPEHFGEIKFISNGEENVPLMPTLSKETEI